MPPKKSSVVAPSDVAYQLDGLLHTMRLIAHYEEHLCSAMHAIQHKRSLPTALRRELLQILEEFPSEACESERNALLRTISAAATDTSQVAPRAARPKSGRSSANKSVSKARRSNPSRINAPKRAAKTAVPQRRSAKGS